MADSPGYMQYRRALEDMFGSAPAMIGRVAIRDGVTAATMASVSALNATPAGANLGLNGLVSVMGSQASTGNPQRIGSEQFSVGAVSGSVGLVTMTEAAMPELVIAKSTWVWANSAAANTQVTTDITFVGRRAKWVWVNVWNPSTVTALTVQVTNNFTDNGAVTRYGVATTFGVATNSARSVLVQYPGGPGSTAAGSSFLPAIRLIASNDTVLGVADGFTASFNVTGQDPAT